jgi:hypothetical protein
MKKITAITAIVLGIGATACVHKSNDNTPEQASNTTSHQTKGHMKNLISIVEIPVNEFSRAKTFYETILDIQIEEADMNGVKLGLFPNEDEGVFVQLIHGTDYKPSAHGTVIYLQGGDDLQKVVDKIKANGGTVLVPKTGIGPDMGFYALFTDSEGNKLGLHSPN